MKTVKRFICALTAILMAVVMAATTGTPVLANEESDILDFGSLTIMDSTESTYWVYKVMYARRITYTESVYVEDDNAMHDVEIETYIYTVSDAFKPFFEESEYYHLTEDNVIQFKNSEGNWEDVATDGIEKTNNSEAAKLAVALQNYARDNVEITTLAGQNGDVDLKIGYYLVTVGYFAYNDEGNLGKTAASPMLVNIKADENLVVYPKSNNDVTLDVEIVEGDSQVKANDINFGDTVNYKITSAIPTYQGSVNENVAVYSIKSLYSGLDIYSGEKLNADSLVLKVNGEILTKDVDYTVSDPVTVPRDSSTRLRNGEEYFTVNLLGKTINAHQGEQVELTYSMTTAEGSEFPLIYSNWGTGYYNIVDLEFSIDTEGYITQTLEDQVMTYTYAFEFRLVDGYTDRNLNGASFTVSDADGNVIGTTEYVDGIPETTGRLSIQQLYDDVDVAYYYIIVNGIDSGTYYIAETKAPSGYSLPDDPYIIKITAIKDEVTQYPTGDAMIFTPVTTAEVEEGHDRTIGAAGVVDDMRVKLKNYAKPTISLPETGSRTAMFCMIGGALLVVLGCAYVLISNRRNA